jgi:hypothetical protein
MFIMASSLVRLDVVVLTVIMLCDVRAAAVPADPPDKNTKAAATPPSVAAANTGTPTRRAGFLGALGLE